MLGLSWTEMMVIGVVALIFIGPKDLPIVMSKVGKIVGQIQRMGREFQREINKTTGLDEVRNLRDSITSPLKQTADEIRREFNAMTPTGQQQPTGVLKPSDPKVESVVDDIREKAGMAPAAKAEATTAPQPVSGETALEPLNTAPAPLPMATPTEPVKAARRSVPKPPTFADTQTAKAIDAEAAPVVEVKRPRAAPKTTKPKAAGTAEAAKPVRKPRAKAAAAVVSDTEAAKPAPKPRAPRKKAADQAGKTE